MTYNINPHLDGKTTAQYPEDFPMLRPGDQYQIIDHGSHIDFFGPCKPSEIMATLKAYIKGEADAHGTRPFYMEGGTTA